MATKRTQSKNTTIKQWRSQSAADARAQHGHTKFASSLVPRLRPAFPLAVRFCGYFRPYCRLELEHFDHAFATNLRARIVRSL